MPDESVGGFFSISRSFEREGESLLHQIKGNYTAFIILGFHRPIMKMVRAFSLLHQQCSIVWATASWKDLLAPEFSLLLLNPKPLTWGSLYWYSSSWLLTSMNPLFVKINYQLTLCLMGITCTKHAQNLALFLALLMFQQQYSIKYFFFVWKLLLTLQYAIAILHTITKVFAFLIGIYDVYWSFFWHHIFFRKNWVIVSTDWRK